MVSFLSPQMFIIEFYQYISMTTNIFTFNIGKDNTNSKEVNYQVLEQLKDGRFIASKFSSKEIKICKPNIVIVFSNNKLKISELAMDRRRLLQIK